MKPQFRITCAARSCRMIRQYGGGLRCRNLLLLAFWALSHLAGSGGFSAWAKGPVPPAAASAQPVARPGLETGPAALQQETAAEQGFRWLRTRPFLPPDFDQQIFDTLWECWPEPWRTEAARAAPEERWRLTFDYYGLVPPLATDPCASSSAAPPGETAPGKPLTPAAGNSVQSPPTALGYVRVGEGWVMNCLACHTGQVAGKTVLGAGNSLFALETLTEDVRWLKLKSRRPLSHLDLALFKMPLGTTQGTTNSVIFGVALAAVRDRDLNVVRGRPAPQLLSHDMDAPPLWNVRRKQYLYADGFAPKGHRPLMQFMLLPVNSGTQFRAWESEFRDVLAWIESLSPPPYPWKVDETKAGRGKAVFAAHCTECHGTYGSQGSYPNRLVPWETVRTDPVRLKSLSTQYRQEMQSGWFGEYGKQQYRLNPQGYVAPPLDGIWASAPYFHNGSVPTLWQVLNPRERPALWKRTRHGYDPTQVGLELETLPEKLPPPGSAAERRRFFDARLPGKSAGGHPFADVLMQSEKLELLEYLKTL